MAVLLRVPSRTSWVGIDHMDLRAIRQAAEQGSSRGMVDRAWTAIKDWFCGTKVGPAKECLLKLYSTHTTDAEKLAAFRELKSLVAAPYRKRFVERQEPGCFSIWLFISGDAAIFQRNLILDNSQIG